MISISAWSPSKPSPAHDPTGSVADVSDEAPHDAPDDPIDAADRSTDAPHDPPAAAPESPTLAAVDVAAVERDLDAVQAALARLADGTYWTDEVTGEPIPADALVADPLARRS